MLSGMRVPEAILTQWVQKGGGFIGVGEPSAVPQPGQLFRLMTAEQRKALFENAVRAMGDAPEEVKLRHIGNCGKADPAYGEGVAKALGISVA